MPSNLNTTHPLFIIHAVTLAKFAHQYSKYFEHGKFYEYRFKQDAYLADGKTAFKMGFDLSSYLTAYNDIPRHRPITDNDVLIAINFGRAYLHKDKEESDV